MTNITIVGAGMAGLLAANMLSRHKPVVIEQQEALPNNHSAVLRFGSDKVADVLGIPFKKVSMLKGTLPWRNPVADALSYAEKCNGVARSDRSIPVGIERGERWIAPPDLIERMALGVKIDFAMLASFKYDNPDWPIISTIPMPALMDVLKYPHKPEFSYVEGANLRAKLLRTDAYVSLYVPDPEFGFNRLSVTGDELIAEYAFPKERLGMQDFINSKLLDDKTHLFQMAGRSADLLGLSVAFTEISFTRQRYAKIQPIDNDERKKFLAWATDNYNIFSLGRFATWRPGLLLDDLVHDIRLIERWINNRYDIKFSR